VPEGTGPNEVRAALAEYVDFAAAGPMSTPIPMALPGGDGSPRKGMLRADAERELGRPSQTSERHEGALTVTTLVFVRGEQRITAEFVEGVLFRYSITSK